MSSSSSSSSKTTDDSTTVNVENAISTSASSLSIKQRSNDETNKRPRRPVVANLTNVQQQQPSNAAFAADDDEEGDESPLKRSKNDENNNNHHYPESLSAATTTSVTLQQQPEVSTTTTMTSSSFSSSTTANTTSNEMEMEDKTTTKAAAAAAASNDNDDDDDDIVMEKSSIDDSNNQKNNLQEESTVLPTSSTTTTGEEQSTGATMETIVDATASKNDDTHQDNNNNNHGTTDTTATDSTAAATTATANPTDPSSTSTSGKGAAAADPHDTARVAMATTAKVLKHIDSVLEKEPQFCSVERAQEWKDEIQHRLHQQDAPPQTMIGVLGNTGVGKSSLLNALLDEASVLPTSGSRGCTAAVVELRFNQRLEQAAKEATQLKEAPGATGTEKATASNTTSASDATTQVPVYQGVVEFISLQEWATELKVLLEECSTHDDKTIYARPPEESRQPDAAAAWAKINQVYGKNYMERYHKEPTERVYQILMSNGRVQNLLTADPGQDYKSVTVEQGLVNAAQAAKLVSTSTGTTNSTTLGGRLKRAKKKWAAAFRSQINGYVYRNNSTSAQTWPLIRKVVLQGPWAVLQTGACLVDLPGVRDANASRAKVAETYLQHLNEIWIVAPIQRAVDDGTAKELLGESFKRRLLMDGNYSSVSFVCTQTDDVEATETMRDHADVAQDMGLWSQMQDLDTQLVDLEKQLTELRQEEEDLVISLEEAREEVKEVQEELTEAKDEQADDEDFADDDDDDDDIEIDEDAGRKQRLEKLQATLKEKLASAGSVQLQLETWRQANKDKMEQLDASSRCLQRQLKSLCARVRNMYSTSQIQSDFRAGLDELLRGPDEEEDVDATDRQAMEALAANNKPIPDDFQMNVYTISSNDYLKVTGIKPSSDGPPNTFSNADDTQIPALKAFVHETTAKHSVAFLEDCVNTTSDLVDRVKLVATDSSDGASSRMSRKCRSVFELEMMSIAKKLEPVVNEFTEKMNHRVNTALQPSLEKGAKKGQELALQTATSWGSKSRRSKAERAPDRNGLYWSTYFATVRRGGVYVSGSAGEIDFNQELCDPMEKEFSADWQRVFDASLRQALRTCEQKVVDICKILDKSLASALTANGIRADRLTTLMTAANRSSRTNLKNAFQAIAAVATNTQRDLNRTLLPLVKSKMEDGYTSVLNAPGGAGRFSRMKMAMEQHCSNAVSTMFDETTVEMLTAIGNMVQTLAGMITAVVDVIEKTFSQVYSVLWDDQQSSMSMYDPVQAQQIQDCRNRVLPDILQLQAQIADAMKLLGIEREQLDLELMGVESWEDRIEKKRKEAEDNGLVVDLCDDDNDDDDADGDKKMPAVPAMATAKPVKNEPQTFLI